MKDKIQRSTNAYPKKCSPITSENKLKCLCLNARSIVNKTSELDIMVAEYEITLVKQIVMKQFGVTYLPRTQN